MSPPNFRSWLVLRGLRAWLTAAAVFVLAVTGVSPAFGQGIPGLDGLAAGVDGEEGEVPVRVRAVAQVGAVRAGEPVVVAVILEHGEHFHTWPAEHVKLPGEVADFAIRTTIRVGGEDERLPAWLARADAVQWPKAEPGKVPDPTGEKPTITAPLYSGKAVAYVRLWTAADAPAGDQTAPVTVAFQACDETMCFAPEEHRLEVRVRVLEAGAADAGSGSGEGAEPGLFDGYQPADEGTGGGGVDRGEASGSKGAAAAAGGASALSEAVAPSAPSLFGMNFGGGAVVLFLLACVGGFILNLTPCVLPVIPIKVMTLTHHAGSPARAMRLGLWMALGVVAFWAAIGVPMAFVSSALDPSRYIFGVWWISLGIGLVIAFLGLGIMGLFNIRLPQSVYRIEPKIDNAQGSFLFGVLTGVLGLPCFGFVAGGLLAGAATLPPLTIMTVFVGLGVGMAAPYLVLSAKPSLLNFVPRAGPASDLVKQVMGLLLMAAAAFFVAAGIKGLLHEKPYLAESMSWWSVTFFVGLAGLWLTYKTLQISKKAWPKVVMPVLSLAAVAGFTVFTYGQVITAREDYRRAEAARAQLAGLNADPDAVITGAWVPYTPGRLERALKSGKVVVVDFTADWCINCKFLKRTILDRDPVRIRVTSDKHVLLEVDNTSSSSPGWAYLQSLGQTGVPTLAIYGPGVEKPIIMNAYTPAAVMEALDRAEGGAGGEGGMAGRGGEAGVRSTAGR